MAENIPLKHKVFDIFVGLSEYLRLQNELKENSEEYKKKILKIHIEAKKNELIKQLKYIRTLGMLDADVLYDYVNKGYASIGKNKIENSLKDKKMELLKELIEEIKNPSGMAVEESHASGASGMAVKESHASAASGMAVEESYASGASGMEKNKNKANGASGMPKENNRVTRVTWWNGWNPKTGKNGKREGGKRKTKRRMNKKRKTYKK